MTKLRVAVVGGGYLGKFHAEKYSRMPEVTLVGVADTDRARADQLARQYATRAFYDHRELLGTVDAVSIVVPTPAHFEVSKDFLEHDVDVLIEKPITTTLEEADQLIAISEKRGGTIQVGHLERFNPAVVALRGIVRRPMFIESHRLSIYKDRGTDVSVVLDLMIHDIDLISNFVDAEVRHIRAAGASVISSQIDIANARLEFENGCVANVTASRISMKNERKIRLFQQDAYVSVDFAQHEITVVNRSGNTQQCLVPGMEIRRMGFTQSDALDDELRAFVQAVRQREVPVVTGRMGRDALHIALDIMEQIHQTSRRFRDF